jgi:PST family polysaccharide transporter
MVSIFVFPLGVGIFMYSDLATELLLGSQWSEASGVIGIWALTSAITIVYGHFCSEVYRAKGKPKISFLAQLLHLIILIPVCIISSKFGFWFLVYARAWIRMQAILVHFIIMKFFMGIPILGILRNVFPTALSAAFMGLLALFLKRSNQGMVWDISSILICTVFYFCALLVFPRMKNDFKNMYKIISRSQKKKQDLEVN